MIREMQVKTTMRYHFTPVKMAIIKRNTDNKSWQGCDVKGDSAYDSSRSFMVSGLTFRSLIHFLVYCCTWCVGMIKCHSFTYSCPVFPALLIEEAVSSPLYILASFAHCIFTDSNCVGLFLGSWFCLAGLCICFWASTMLFWYQNQSKTLQKIKITDQSLRQI